ncbi:MAG: stalk domain-containing protein [Clostridia bacterium]|nr:stalk domain-containing protein [Clostridia bacterium]
MKKSTLFIILALITALTCSTGLALSRLEKYALVINRQPLTLTNETGYVYKEGSVLAIPIQTVCDALGYSYTLAEKTKTITITRPDDKDVVIRAGSKFAVVNGKKYSLRLKTVAQTGGKVYCDVRIVKYMQAGFKHYKPSLAKPAGYASGALVIADDGDLSLPYVDVSDEILPSELHEAAKSTRQIVGVEQISGSKAKLTLYEKTSNSWLEQYSCEAYIGRNGIGKTAEGDGKTPSGTYNLNTPFGILADPGSKMSGYTKVTKYHYWCSTSSSKYYNRLVDIRNVDYTPGSMDEKLVNYAPYYNYALFIDYNASGEPGKGSAIFLHCKGSAKSTSGCIAIPQAVMKSLIMSLGEGAKIVIY